MKAAVFHRKARIAVEMATELFGYSEDDFRGRSMKQPLVWYRHILMVWLRNNSSASMDLIGKYFNRDHSVVCHAVQNLGNWRSIGDEMADNYTLLDELCDRFLQAEEQTIQPPINQVSLSIGMAFLSGVVIDLDRPRCRCSAKVEGRMISPEVSHA